MIGLTIWVLIGLYIWLFLLIGKRNNRWKDRFVWWVVLFAPIAVLMWEYPLIYFQHKLACKNEGGLKVFIEPENADQIQLDAKSFYEPYAKHLLANFSPDLKLVEALDRPSAPEPKYFAFTLDAHSTNLPKSEWQYKKNPLKKPTSGMYVLNKSNERKDEKRFKTVWSLTRNGTLYAQWTSLQYYWSTSGLFASQIGWRCFDRDMSGAYPHQVLTKLILK